MSLTDNNDNLSIAPLLVDHRARRSRCVGAGAARTVGRGQTPHPERVVEDGQRPPVDDGRAAGYHDHRR